MSHGPRSTRRRRLRWAIGLVATFGLLASGCALSATWTPQTVAPALPASPDRIALTDVACPAIGACVAVGSRTTVLTERFVLRQNGSGWKQLALPIQVDRLGGVSCRGVDDCLISTGAIDLHVGASGITVVPPPPDDEDPIAASRPGLCRRRDASRSSARRRRGGTAAPGRRRPRSPRRWSGSTASCRVPPPPAASSSATASPSRVGPRRGRSPRRCGTAPPGRRRSRSATARGCSTSPAPRRRAASRRRACEPTTGPAGFRLPGPQLLRWNGSAWSTVALSFPGAAPTEPPSVACASATSCTALWVAGESSPASPSYLGRWNGSTWTVTTTTAAASIVSLGCGSATSCVGVGGPTAQQLSGTAWSTMPIAALHIAVRGARARVVRDGDDLHGDRLLGPVRRRWRRGEPACRSPAGSTGRRGSPNHRTPTRPTGSRAAAPRAA